MEIELEKKIVGAVLDKPKYLGLKEIKAEWFYHQDTFQVINTLLTSEQTFTDLSEVAQSIKANYPKTNVTEKELRFMQFDGAKIDSLSGALKTLEHYYVQNHIDEAIRNYTENKTTQNKESVENWFRKLNELDIEDDDGSVMPAINDLFDEMENGVKKGVLTYPNIDKVLGNGMEGGSLIVIGARPAVGKTAFAINLAVQALQRQPGINIDFFTLEMTKKQMLKRFVARLTRINSYRLKNTKNLPDKDKQEVIAKADFIYKSGLRIHDSRFKVSEIERMIRQRKHEIGDEPYMAIVDYLGLINPETPNAQRSVAIGKITRTMKLLTNELDIPIVLLSQLNRGIEGRNEKKPTLSDLRESGDIEQDANVVGFLYNIYEEDGTTDNPKVMFDIAKNREGSNLPLQFKFNKPEMYFEELNE